MNAVSQLYGYVLLSNVVMGLSCIIFGYVYPGRARNRIFNEGFMIDNFGDEHKKTFGQQIKGGGYPDMGNGYYARNFTYEQWYEFNNAQRAHYNYVQWVAPSLLVLTIGGLYFPITNALLGFGATFTRFMYACGFVMRGPPGRILGSLGNYSHFFPQVVFAILSAIMFIEGHSLVKSDK